MSTSRPIVRGSAHRRLRAALAFGATAAVSLVSVASAQAYSTGAKPSPTTVAPTALAPGATPGLPASVDLTANAVPSGNQGGVSSCVAWAVGKHMVGFYAKRAGVAQTDFAPMFIYSQSNTGRNSVPPTDSGSWPGDALAVATTQGIDTKAHYSHGDFDWLPLPSAADKANAANYKLAGFEQLFGNTPAGTAGEVEIKNALAGGSPVAVSIHLHPSFGTLNSTNNLYTESTGADAGYHEVLALGYNADGLLIQNSWGTGWGNAGFARLAWNVVRADIDEANVATGWGTQALPFINDFGSISGSTTSQTLLGNVELNGSTPGTATFQWGTTTSYGSSATQTLTDPANNLISKSLTGLTPGTIYHYKVTISTAAGSVNSGDRTFVTRSAPVINDLGAIGTGTTTKTLLGNADLFARSTGTATFQYGTTTSYGTTVTQSLTADGQGLNNALLSASLTGLTPGTIYHYKATVTTTDGTVSTADKTFATSGPPVINDIGAIGTGTTTKTLLGNADLFTAGTGTATFQYGTTSSYGTTVTKSLTGDGTSSNNALLSASLTGLTPGTIYHYKVTVTSSYGTVSSVDKTFTTA